MAYSEGLISVIVPVYNAEKYLKRCVESIIRQTWKQLEIILVDDGSRDSSPKLCDEYAALDERIRVIHQQNAGAGQARNAGLAVASGEYLVFFDSDDYADLELIEKAYQAARAYQADAVCFGIYNVGVDGNIWQTVTPHLEKSLYRGKEITEELLPDMISQNPYTGELHFPFLAVYTGMYSHELIRKIDWSFVSEREIAFEDCYSLLKFYHAAERVYVLSDSLYYYCDQPASLSNTIFNGRSEYLEKSHMACIQLCEELGLVETVKLRLSQVYLDNVIAQLKQIVAFQEKGSLSAFCQVLDNPHVTEVAGVLPTNAMGMKKKLLIFGMKHRWNLFVWFMMWLKRGSRRG